MSEDLITWLRATLDEDEQDARRRDFHTGMCSRFLDPGGDCSCDYSDFVLAEVEAKRRMAHHLDQINLDPAWPMPARNLAAYTLRLLALPYADRSGYRDEWRPDRTGGNVQVADPPHSAP